MSININKAFGIHANALLLHSRRSELLATNMANADTPHYKARDIDFKEILNCSSENIPVDLSTTHPVHLNTGSVSGRHAYALYRIPQQPSLDGNTVDTQIEKSAFAENALRYQISLQFLGSKIKGIMNALRVEA